MIPGLYDAKKKYPNHISLMVVHAHEWEEAVRAEGARPQLIDGQLFYVNAAEDKIIEYRK